MVGGGSLPANLTIWEDRRMLKRMRAAHPFLYCILAVVLFLAVMRAGTTVFVLVLTLLGPAVYWPFAQEDFLLQSVNELFGVLAGVFLLGRTGRLWVYRQRGPRLSGRPSGGDGTLCHGQPGLQRQSTAGAGGGVQTGVADRGVFSCVCSSSAWRRRTLFRGVIAETLLEHFGPGRAGVWKACLGLGAAVRVRAPGQPAVQARRWGCWSSAA